MTDLKDRIPNASAAERALAARYASLPENECRQSAFEAFAKSGLPHRRMEAWKWSDFKSALPVLEGPSATEVRDPFADIDACRIKVDQGRFECEGALPAGVRIVEQTEVLGLAGAEELPLGALTAALSGQNNGVSMLKIEVTEATSVPLHFVCAADGEETNFARVCVLVRPGASVELVESHLGGAGFSSFLLDVDVQPRGRAARTLYQRGTQDEAQAITATVHLEKEAEYRQTALGFGAKISRLETRLVFDGARGKALINTAYLAGDGYHIDATSHVRHGAEQCVTRQLTKGAVLDGGTGVFQGKFHVPRDIGQYTDADMQHQALLLEDGAQIFAKPELEIYADDVECAHGNTSGALDMDQLFYMRQRGIPEKQARALLTEAFIHEALDETPEDLAEVLKAEAGDWLSRL